MAITDLENVSIYADFIRTELEALEIGWGWHLCYKEDEFARGIRATITGYIWSEKLGKHKVSYPRDWWEALKQRFAPRWLLRKWPVQFTIVVLEARALYPDFQCSVPSGNYRMHLTQIK